MSRFRLMMQLIMSTALPQLALCLSATIRLKPLEIILPVQVTFYLLVALLDSAMV